MMENNQTIFNYVTYKFYDERGRRLAIFGRDLGDGSLEVITFTCSKKDIFSKSFAKALYFSWMSPNFNIVGGSLSPKVETVKIHENKPKVTFLDFCKSKYHRLRTRSISLEFDEMVLDKLQVVEARQGIIPKKATHVLVITERY